MSRTVLIIGVTGFVGAQVARAFLGAGWRVHGFGPPVAAESAPSIDPRIATHSGGVEDADALARAVGAAEPALIVSFAAFGSGRVGLLRSGEADSDRALAVNVAGFRRVLDAARAACVPRVLWSSSTVVYGPPELYGAARVDEGDECRPRSFYGLTKLMAEDVTRFYRDRHELAVSALRLPLVIGPGLWYEGAAAELARLFRAAAPGARTTIAGPPGAMDLMYVKDVAAAFLAAAATPKLDAVYNINGFSASMGEVVEAVRRRMPDYAVAIERRDPAFAFPLVSCAAFTAATGFRPGFGLEATADDYLHELERSHEP
jgi:UDP-glucose 4-epimerase